MSRAKNNTVNSCCPHCGGTTGVGQIVRWEKFVGQQRWPGYQRQDQDDISDCIFDSVECRGGKTGRCMDCGKRVKVA